MHLPQRVIDRLANLAYYGIVFAFIVAVPVPWVVAATHSFSSGHRLVGWLYVAGGALFLFCLIGSRRTLEYGCSCLALSVFIVAMLVPIIGVIVAKEKHGFFHVGSDGLYLLILLVGVVVALILDSLYGPNSRRR